MKKTALIVSCIILTIAVWIFVISEFILPLAGCQYENDTYAGITRRDAENKALEAAGEGAQRYGEYEGETPEGIPAWIIKVEMPGHKVTEYYVSGDFCLPETAFPAPGDPGSGA